MRLLVLSLLALLAGCTAVLLGSGSEPPRGEQSAGLSGDAATTAAVRERLDREPGLAQQSIGVSTYGGRVTLTGSVNTYTERNLAGQVARTVSGVTGVDNRIRVRVD